MRLIRPDSVYAHLGGEFQLRQIRKGCRASRVMSILRPAVMLWISDRSGGLEVWHSKTFPNRADAKPERDVIARYAHG